MAYRLVYTNFWSDPTTMDDMTPEERYFYLYILTNPCTSFCGIYRISKTKMSYELGYPIEVVENLLDRFEHLHKVIAYNPSTKELAIKNWGKYNLIRGGKTLLNCLAAELSNVKDKSLIQYILKGIPCEAIRELYKSFYDTPTIRERYVDNTYTSTSTSTNTNTGTLTDTDTDTVKNTESAGYMEKDICTIHETSIEDTVDSEPASVKAIEEYKAIVEYTIALDLSAVKAAVIQHAKNTAKSLEAATEADNSS